MTTRNIKSTAIHLILFSTGIALFAWFINGGTLYRSIAIAGLILPVSAVYHKASHYGNTGEIWGMGKRFPVNIFFLFASLLTGIWAGIAYRQSIGMQAWPVAFTGFAIMAACIGATEEIIFRGVTFYLLKNISPIITICLSALLHASYKTLLFLSPFVQQPVDTGRLFYITCLAGLVLGMLRHFSASVGPPLLAHASWDIWVYGENMEAPWWVW